MKVIDNIGVTYENPEMSYCVAAIRLDGSMTLKYIVNNNTELRDISILQCDCHVLFHFLRDFRKVLFSGNCRTLRMHGI